MHPQKSSSRNLLIVMAIIVVLIAAGAYFALQKSDGHGADNPSDAGNHVVSGMLSPDAYPLYNGLTWNSELPATMQLGTTTRAGYSVSSDPVGNITDIAMIVTPFEEYYQTKLAGLGWTEDQTLAADGAGSSMRVFEKGNEYIALMYMSDFSGGGTSSPAICPCTVTTSLWSSRAQ